MSIRDNIEIKILCQYSYETDCPCYKKGKETKRGSCCHKDVHEYYTGEENYTFCNNEEMKDLAIKEYMKGDVCAAIHFEYEENQ